MMEFFEQQTAEDETIRGHIDALAGTFGREGER